jgi:hypothetical protein
MLDDNLKAAATAVGRSSSQRREGLGAMRSTALGVVETAEEEDVAGLEWWPLRKMAFVLEKELRT